MFELIIKIERCFVFLAILQIYTDNVENALNAEFIRPVYLYVFFAAIKPVNTV